MIPLDRRPASRNMRAMSLLKRIGKWTAATLLWLVVAFCLTATIVPHFLDRVYYRGPASAHFDGQRFFNPDGDDPAPPTGGSRIGFLMRQLRGDPERPVWPERVAVRPTRPPARVEGEAMLATWVGHATVLVQTNGLNILTDPIWSDRAGPFGIGPGRVAAPGVRFEDLPRIDLVVISHNHYDHMDLATLKRLWDRDQPVFVTSLGNDSLLRGAGIPESPRHDCYRCPGVRALDWGQGTPVWGNAIEAWKARPAGAAPVARVRPMRTHHWGSRWFRDRNRALWSGFLVETPAGGSIFFAGDTGIGDGGWPGEARAAALGPIRLAILPIGAFRFEKGQMGSGTHIGPRDAIRAWHGLGQPFAIPMHWGTFRLSWEGYRTPPDLLAAMLRCAGSDAARFAPVAIGAPVRVPPLAAQHAARGPDFAALAACEKRGAFDALR